MRGALRCDPMDGSDRIVRAAARPEAVRAVEKVLLVDRLPHFPQRPLHDFVFRRRDPDGPRAPVVFREVDAPDRLVPILPSLHPCPQSPHLLGTPCAVCVHAHAVHPYGRVFAQSPVGAQQRFLVEEVRQRQNPLVRMPLGSFRALQQFR